MSRMFSFITKVWNPLGGECRHGCVYCWARKLAADRKMAKYQGEPRLIERELKRKFTSNDFIFVCDMLDLFGEWVPDYFIYQVLTAISYSKAKFLLLTKNPKRTVYWSNYLSPWNTMVGVTIETNKDDLVSKFSKAPMPTERLEDGVSLAVGVLGKKIKRFVSIEPILDFDFDTFFEMLVDFNPWAVAVGYDNYYNRLPEPPLTKTMQLIDRLEKAGITVYRKTLREAWNATK